MVAGRRRAHAGSMDTAHDSRPPGGPPPPGSRPPLGGLTRATDDTVISGLCGGLGRQFGIDPLVFRIAFVVMSLAGGTGILLYLVGWALVPDDQGKAFGAQWLPGKDRSHKLLAAGLAGVGLILLLDQITDGHGDDVPLGLVLGRTGGGGVVVPPVGARGVAPAAAPAPPSRPDGGWAAPPATAHRSRRPTTIGRRPSRSDNRCAFDRPDDPADRGVVVVFDLGRHRP